MLDTASGVGRLDLFSRSGGRRSGVTPDRHPGDCTGLRFASD